MERVIRLILNLRLLNAVLSKVTPKLSIADICKNYYEGDKFIALLEDMTIAGWCSGSDLEKTQRLIQLGSYYKENFYYVVAKQFAANKEVKRFLMLHTSFSTDPEKVDQAERAVALALMPSEEDYEVLNARSIPDEILDLFKSLDPVEIVFDREPVRIVFQMSKYQPVVILDTNWESTKKRVSVREFISKSGNISMRRGTSGKQQS